MRHRKRGRTLGRSPSHRRALLRNLASSLFLTERDDEFADNAPQVKGRVVTTLHKAKEVRPLVEKCVTIARRSLASQEAAEEFATDAERGSETWKSWRQSETWQKWNNAIAPALAARRRALQLLGNPEAVRILFDDVAPRMADRPGGYTRVLKLAQPRLGDAGPRAILEFVGERDRIRQESERPAFDSSDSDEATEDERDEAESSVEESADTKERADQSDVEASSQDASDDAAESGDTHDETKKEG